MTQSQGKITFSYHKAQGTQALFISGAWGGVTPDQHVYMALFSEHQTLPEEAVHLLDPSGRLGPEVTPPPKELRVLRQIEAETILSYDAAVALRAWLDEKVKAIEAMRQRPPKTDRGD